MLEKATPPYTDVAMRLLFCTTIVAGKNRYRIRELEFYAAEDPYTHQGDEQVSTCGGWYFHRTKPGGGWKGGTFMGIDISFLPVGKAGGILIRGLSLVSCKDGDQKYIDGSCNCVRELLKACGVSKIAGLVEKSDFQWDALAKKGLMRLLEHEPLLVQKTNENSMEWKATSRVGLSAPEKKPDQLKERKKFHLRPFRFLSAPFETKKEKTNIKNSKVGGVFTMQDCQTVTKAEVGYEKMKDVLDGDDDEAGIFDGSDGDKDTKTDSAFNTKKKKAIEKVDIFADSDEEDVTKMNKKTTKKLKDELKSIGSLDSSEEQQNEQPSKNGPDSLYQQFLASLKEGEGTDGKSEGVQLTRAVWYYWLDKGMDGKKCGWHPYDQTACNKLEGFLQNKGKQLSRTTWHLKSGFFSYEVDIKEMTQRNTESGTVRPIRRVLPGGACMLCTIDSAEHW